MLALDVNVGLRSFELDAALDVGAETVALAGPSGAGKTTLLRAVAGLARPQRGRIALAETVWFDRARRVDLAPERRSVGLVFQEYALFPHMSVRDNVAFAGRDRADALLQRLGIADLSRARPAAISGGERQRVALARALARDPAVLLLDEPLAALDAHTRATVRRELRALLDGLCLPALVVTHSFADAAALADRIAVLVAGRVLQIGTAHELVERPADAFVAAFTGAVLLNARAEPLPSGGSRLALAGGGELRAATVAAGDVQVALRPWEIELAPDGDLVRTVSALAPAGPRVLVQLGDIEAECEPVRVAELGLRPGARVGVRVATSNVRVFSEPPVPLAANEGEFHG